jgi:NAD-dependent deacetylase
MNAPLSSNHQRIARWLLEARHAVAFTGAGISTESGIPDFRSPGGVWTKYRMVLYGEFLESPEARLEYWRQKAESHAEFGAAKPNAGHRVLAGWEERGRIAGVITQNIDELHQEAGSRQVWELHGTARKVQCLDCRFRSPVEPFLEQFRATGTVPDCPDCGGRLKHATVSFGQMLPPDVLQSAFQTSRQADLFLAIGSSLVVEPAASLPATARRHGARLVIINRDSTPLDESADVVLHEEIGAALTAIDRAMGARDEP